MHSHPGPALWAGGSLQEDTWVGWHCLPGQAHVASCPQWSAEVFPRQACGSPFPTTGHGSRPPGVTPLCPPSSGTPQLESARSLGSLLTGQRDSRPPGPGGLGCLSHKSITVTSVLGPEGSISIYGVYILRYWGLGLHHVNFGGT